DAATTPRPRARFAYPPTFLITLRLAFPRILPGLGLLLAPSIELLRVPRLAFASGLITFDNLGLHHDEVGIRAGLRSRTEMPPPLGIGPAINLGLRYYWQQNKPKQPRSHRVSPP